MLLSHKSRLTSRVCACAGDGGTTDSAMPVEVSGNHMFVAISGGWWFTCGVDSAGRGWCWGAFLVSAIVSGVFFLQMTLPAFCNTPRFCLTSRVCACAGDGYNGQLGNGGNTDSSVPVEVSGNHTFKAISAGGSHTCGVDSLGRAWCWGEYVACDLSCLPMPDDILLSHQSRVCVHVQVRGAMTSWATETLPIHLCPWRYRATTQLW